MCEFRINSLRILFFLPPFEELLRKMGGRNTLTYFVTSYACERFFSFVFIFFFFLFLNLVRAYSVTGNESLI